MAAIERRKIVRRLVIAVASVVLLLLGYLGSIASLVFASNAGWVPNSVRGSPVFFWYGFPAFWYASQSDWPGCEACEKCLEWCMHAGQKMRNEAA